MHFKAFRRTAFAVAVLAVAGVIAASAGADPAIVGGPAASGATGASNDSSTGGAVDLNGGSTGATGTSAPAGATDSSGATGATGSTGASAPAGTTSSEGSTAAPATPVDTGSSDTSASTPAGATGTSGTSGASGPSGPTGPSGGDGTPTVSVPSLHHHHRHHHDHGPGAGAGSPSSSGAGSAAPQIVASQSQPSSSGGGVGVAAPGTAGQPLLNGPTAPPPSLFEGSNPLAGVLPGSWEDPFIVDGKAQVPAFYIESYHVPAFLLPIYQAAGSAYGIPWQTLAAINEVETDYGTNLDVSSAGAIGWMQFLPSTWKRYGVDASASGQRDPYNAADAIFAAAKYLAAAGGAHNLPRAIFAYNHSRAYVRSVLERAQLLSGEPAALVNSVSELAEGDFPIQLGYRASYRAVDAGSSVAASGKDAGGAAPTPSAAGAAALAGLRKAPAVDIYAQAGAAVVAAQDGTLVAIGRSRRLGRYVVVRNAFGEHFTYGHLASISGWYPTPKAPSRSAAILSAALPAALAPGPRPTGAPASAGAQPAKASTPSALRASSHRARGTSARHVTVSTSTAPVIATINLRSKPSAKTLFTPLPVLERALHRATTTAHPAKKVHRVERAAILARYFTGIFGLRPAQLTVARLRVGSHVLAGTILGRLGAVHGKREPHLLFEISPGAGEPLIDPRPFLDAWSQLATLELHRDSFAAAPFYGPNLHPRSVGTLELTSQLDIERIVLQDTRVHLASCERSAIIAGDVDRRALISLEVLVLHGIDPTVSGAWCSGHKREREAAAGILKTGNALELTALDGRPAVGTAAAIAIHALSQLHPAERPAISERTVPGTLVIAFAPATEPQVLAVAASFTSGFALSAPRWAALDDRLQQILEPRMPTAVSRAALPDPPTATKIRKP